MTLTRISAALLFSASLWSGGIVFLRAVVTDTWRGPEIWMFCPLALAGVVIALFVGMQWTPSRSRNRIFWQPHHFPEEQNK
jgi:hypothetical protein